MIGLAPEDDDERRHLKGWVRAALFLGLGTVLVVRTVVAIVDLGERDPTAFLTLPLGAILPTLLAVALLAMPPARTTEGALMRVGTVLHLLLILCLPPLALHLALGLPVVFLAVELYQTRLPRMFRDPLTRLVLA